MSKYCPQCKNENPSAASFCMFCGILLNTELPQCPNCKEEYTEVADFCLHCGNALTNKAKKNQNKADTKELFQLKNKIEILNKKLKKVQENRIIIKNNLQKEISKNNVLQNGKNVAETKLKEEISKNKETANTNALPKWFYIFVTVVTSICFLILFLVIIGVI